MVDYDDMSEVTRREAELSVDDDWPGQLPEYVEEWNYWWWFITLPQPPCKDARCWREVIRAA